MPEDETQVKTIRALTAFEKSVIRVALEELRASTKEEDSYNWGAKIILNMDMVDGLMWAVPKKR